MARTVKVFYIGDFYVCKQSLSCPSVVRRGAVRAAAARSTSAMTAMVHCLYVLLLALTLQHGHASARHVLQAPAAAMTSPSPAVASGTPAASPAAAPAASPAGTKAPNSSKNFPTLDAAFKAANLTTLAAAVQAAGLDPKITESATILAPTNKAFKTRLQQDLKMTPQQFLQNKTLLVEVLSYHIIPGVLRANQLSEGKQLQTALAGAAPLVVKINRTKANGSPRRVPQIEIDGATNKAAIKTRNTMVGSTTVVHVVDDVLLPAGVGQQGKANSG